MSNCTDIKMNKKETYLQSMFEAGESVRFGFAHLHQVHVEDLFYLLEQLAFYTTQLMCESHTELCIINSTYKEGVC